jgi:hypothetical protein
MPYYRSSTVRGAPVLRRSVHWPRDDGYRTFMLVRRSLRGSSYRREGLRRGTRRCAERHGSFVTVHPTTTKICENARIVCSSSTAYAHCRQLADAVSSFRIATVQGGRSVHLRIRDVLKCDCACDLFSRKDTLFAEPHVDLNIGRHISLYCVLSSVEAIAIFESFYSRHICIV